MLTEPFFTLAFLGICGIVGLSVIYLIEQIKQHGGE